MSVQKSDKPARSGAAVALDFLNDDDDVPELNLASTVKPAGSETVPQQGIDLGQKRKIVFFTGRGKTGKTTTIRYVAERAVAAQRSILMADMDPTNGTFSAYFSGVARLSDPSDPTLALKWLNKLVQHALETKSSLLVDLGGGDTVLRRLVAETPDLVSMIEAEETALVMFYTAGPNEEDLSPLRTMTSMAFVPSATGIVLNEGLVDLGETREKAFSRVLRHSAVREALGHDAVIIWMPRLIPAQQIEIRRLSFRDAVDGRVGQAKTPLGPFDRSRAHHWLRAMEANFKGVETWLP